MKVLVVFLCLATSAFSSLEPAGYRPPGSPRPSLQYLSPLDHQRPSSQYLPPTFGSPSFLKSPLPLDPPPLPTSQFLPPTLSQNSPVLKTSFPVNKYLHPSKENPLVPPPTYLPPIEKPSEILQPSINYLPPKGFSDLQQTPWKSSSYLAPKEVFDVSPIVNYRENADGLHSNYLPPQTRGVVYKVQGIPATWPKTSYLAPPGIEDAPNFQTGSIGTTPISTYVSTENIPRSTTHAPEVTPSPNFIPPKENLPVSNFKSAQESRDVLHTSNYLPPVEGLDSPRNYKSPVIPLPTSNYLPPKEVQGLVPKTEDKPKAIITIVATSPAPPAYFGNEVTKYSKPQIPLRPEVGSSSVEQGRFAKTYPSIPFKNSFPVPAVNYLPANQYDAAASGVFGNSIESGGSAKYNFEYQVSDEFGNDFGHKETRSGSNAQGVYSVLMPDGRKQIVHYEADEGGFKPRISYEEANDFATSSFAGYDRNANNIDAQGPY